MSYQARHRKEIRTEFAGALAARLGRTEDEIAERGLFAGDFGINEEVDLTLDDGSTMHLRYAFYVLDAEGGRLGVFSEHCGYFSFSTCGLRARLLRSGKIVAEHDGR